MKLKDFNDETLEEIANYIGVEVYQLSDYDVEDVIIWHNCNDMSDVAWEYAHEVYNWDDFVYTYFDYEKFGNDLDIEGYFFPDGDGNMVEMR